MASSRRLREAGGEEAVPGRVNHDVLSTPDNEIISLLSLVKVRGNFYVKEPQREMNTKSHIKYLGVNMTQFGF